MGSKIKLLSEEVANQIAAGEVVERPASVAKELLENSLDAGAKSLQLEIEQGGRRLIKVTDDGEGMSREDALLCLERHATSKIRTGADLFAIRTMGFRGEALPSIASVSEMTISTREREADAGTRVMVSAGAVKNVVEAGLPPGTEIEVRRLFFNVPARRKFLKSVETELGHITNLVSNMALARPDIHFRLVHNGEQMFDLPSSADLGGRLRQALGADAVANLVPVDFSAEIEPGRSLHVHGYVSLPTYTRSSARSLHLFVNRRFVRDRLLSHAVFEAYRTLIPRGRFPLVALFLDLAPELVDVNVHPAKVEVRFREQTRVHDQVMTAVQQALQVRIRPGLNFDDRCEGSVPGLAFGPTADHFPLPESEPSPEEAERAGRVNEAIEQFAERQLARQRVFFGPERRPWPASDRTAGAAAGGYPSAPFASTPSPESAPPGCTTPVFPLLPPLFFRCACLPQMLTPFFRYAVRQVPPGRLSSPKSIRKRLTPPPTSQTERQKFLTAPPTSQTGRQKFLTAPS